MLIFHTNAWGQLVKSTILGLISCPFARGDETAVNEVTCDFWPALVRAPLSHGLVPYAGELLFGRVGAGLAGKEHAD
jgi:hypothetical protein